MQTRACMDISSQYLQNILNEHLQIMHGYDDSIKLTWQHNVTVTELTDFTKFQKTANIKWHTLQA